MVSDFQILGIEETDDPAAIKRAYRRRAKQLHPDTADNEILVNNHFPFVEVCKAYARLMARAKTVADIGADPEKPSVHAASNPRAKPVSPARERPTAARPVAPTAAATAGTAVVKHADPAYAYYKNGITIFGKIHPSEWKTRSRSTLTKSVGLDEEDQREAQRKVMGLVALFPKAYWYFSVVANEYPESPWAADARDKMGLIEERMIRYKSIIESFSQWPTYAEAEKERYRAMMKSTAEKYANDHERMKKDWDGKE